MLRNCNPPEPPPRVKKLVREERGAAVSSSVWKKVDDVRILINFIIHYEIDGEDTKTVLRMDEYGGDEAGAWVLLAAQAPPAVQPGAAGPSGVNDPSGP